MPTYSKCVSCGEVKEVEMFHRLRIVNGRREYASACKACINLGKPDTGIRAEAARLGLDRIPKVCSKCKIEKPGTSFGARRVDGKVYHTPKCSDCRNTVTRRRRDDPAQRLFDGAKARAKKCGIEFTLKCTDLVIPAVCPVFRIPLQVSRGKRTDSSPTLDRIDPTRGYTPDNVRVISWKANRLKSNMTSEELYALYTYASLCHAA